MDNSNYENLVHISSEDAARIQSAFVNRVYSWMSTGLAVTGAVAWYLGTQKIEFILRHANWFLPLMVIEVLLVMALGWMINKISSFAAGAMFFVYSALNGVTLSWIFLAYQIGSVANVFFVTCATFAGMSVFNPDNYPFEIEDGINPGPSCRECHYYKNGKCPDACVHSEEEWGREAQALDGYVKDSCMYQSDMSVHDNGIAIVEYENGVRASHSECFVCGKSYRSYTVVGTKAIAHTRTDSNVIVVEDRFGGGKTTYEISTKEGGHGGADPGLVDSFIRAIKGEKVQSATFEEGLISTAIGQAAELSKEEDRTVFIKELTGE